MPTLQQQARLWQLNYYMRLWFRQMCLCRFYFPLLLRLANDVETNPVDQRSGPSWGTQREYSSKPLKHTFVKLFWYLNGRYRHIFIP